MDAEVKKCGCNNARAKGVVSDFSVITIYLDLMDRKFDKLQHLT